MNDDAMGSRYHLDVPGKDNPGINRGGTYTWRLILGDLNLRLGHLVYEYPRNTLKKSYDEP